MSDLAKRAVACKHWRWMPGMLAIVGVERQRVLSDKLPAYPDWIPDLDDPATIGCLLALVREAWGQPRLHARPDGHWWRMHADEPAALVYASESEALVAALEAAPC